MKCGTRNSLTTDISGGSREVNGSDRSMKCGGSGLRAFHEVRVEIFLPHPMERLAQMLTMTDVVLYTLIFKGNGRTGLLFDCASVHSGCDLSRVRLFVRDRFAPLRRTWWNSIAQNFQV